MATLVKTPSGTWKALIRKNGWPTVAKTFRTKRDAEDWSRRTEEEMVRGVYIRRSGSEKMTLEAALKRYLSDITPTKKPTTQRGETSKAKKLIEHLGKYSMAALSAEIIASYRDKRLNEPTEPFHWASAPLKCSKLRWITRCDQSTAIWCFSVSLERTGNVGRIPLPKFGVS
ncbi:Site-specific recombinase XerD [Pseudomonas savastanoi pv. glycinea]|uniref:Site-specific recombinase XerD n=2 Tax=Pseudomonas savastanoi pv. glycinea TaxID=318 RepID=A0A3M3URL5_PSESG|nr:Site-specific recombinase XerD [Pseudomonas savastanoi pv. glycinea]RMO35642.1 Site-specific recombinase XerD [Pseudomonas savastanoi pv. glycinea]